MQKHPFMWLFFAPEEMPGQFALISKAAALGS
jgi:hypothetical protein